MPGVQRREETEEEKLPADGKTVKNQGKYEGESKEYKI